MEFWLCVLIGILIIIILVLAVKIVLLQKSADEIAEEFADRLTTDTNTLIDLPSRDPCMRRLASDINAQLRLLRENIVIHEGVIATLKRFKDDQREVAQGYECGISLEKFADLQVGDIFEAYIIEEYKD